MRCRVAAVEVGDEPDAAGVVLVARIVERSLDWLDRAGPHRSRDLHGSIVRDGRPDVGSGTVTAS